jgi:hypothetical protein
MSSGFRDGQPAPDQGRDLAQPDVELIDVNDGGRLAHGIASLPRSTAMSSQYQCRQPPLCDGLESSHFNKVKSQNDGQDVMSNLLVNAAGKSPKPRVALGTAVYRRSSPTLL